MQDIINMVILVTMGFGYYWVVATPPPCDFPIKRLHVIYTNPKTQRHKNESKFMGAVWAGGIVKVFGRQ